MGRRAQTPNHAAAQNASRRTKRETMNIIQFKLARRLASSAMNREWATILHDAHKGY
jgi:hypothetical protein